MVMKPDYTPNGPTAPNALRQALRRARRALDAPVRRRHARALSRRLGRDLRFLRARRIGAYLATDGEMDPAPLLARAGARHIYLPVLRPHPERTLWFIRHRPGDRLLPNRYGIPEPTLRGRHILPPWHLDLLLVPLVGFDPRGHRLGMGGGFYDRSLAYLRHRRHWRRPLLVGLAHECQRVPELPLQAWDIPLDLVATEERIYSR